MVDKKFGSFVQNTLGPIALWLIGLFLSMRPMILSLGRLMPEDPGDTRFNSYILEHGFRWITRNPMHLSLWDPPFFYPEKNVFAYSDYLLGTAPFFLDLARNGSTNGHELSTLAVDADEP